MKGRYQLVLASASPRRLSLLRELGLYPHVYPAQVDERRHAGEAAGEFVLRLAETKCRATLERYRAGNPPCVILAADTAVVVGNRILGKPRDAPEAVAMLRLLRGRTHEVLTGAFLIRADNGDWTSGMESTRVFFRSYDDETIRSYVESGEPLDKAGAYGIQGGGARLAERIEGSWSNVVGFPLEMLPLWMGRIGVELRQFIPGPGGEGP